MRKLPRGWGPEGQPGASTGPESRSSLRGRAQERGPLLQDPRGVPTRSKQTTKGRRQKERLLGSSDWETGFSKRKRHRRWEKQAGVSEAEGGRATPPPTTPSQGKAIGESFPTDRKSRRRTAGQLREGAGPCSDHMFLGPEVRRPPRPHRHRKGSLETKGESCQGMFYPDTFAAGSVLAKRCMGTPMRSLRCTKYGPRTRKSE